MGAIKVCSGNERRGRHSAEARLRRRKEDKEEKVEKEEKEERYFPLACSSSSQSLKLRKGAREEKEKGGKEEES